MPTPIYSGYPTPPGAPEPLEYGNINVLARRAVKITETNGVFKIDPFAKEGKYEWGTLLSITIGPMQVAPYGKVVVLLPSISDDGAKILTEAEARKKYEKDKLHLGIFSTAKVPGTVGAKKFLADEYAEKLSALENERIRRERDALASQDSSDSGKYDFSEKSTADVGFIGSIFKISGLSDQVVSKINERLMSLNVSYSMNQSTELSASFLDDDYTLTSEGYFDLRRRFVYRGRIYEVSGTETGPGSGGSPIVSVNLQPAVVQELRRDKKPEAIGGTSGYEYARRVAASKGLDFVGEKSNKQQSIFKSSSSSTDESVWEVMGRSSDDSQITVFEVDGLLVWGTMNWMLWKFGLGQRKNKKGIVQKYLELSYDPQKPNSGAGKTEVLRRERTYFLGPDGEPVFAENETTTVEDNGIFELTGWPRIRMSENDGLEGEGSCEVASPNGKLIRPGHTVFMSSVPEHFRGGYLVSDVSFSEFNNQPASVTYVTPQKPKNQTKPEE